MAILTSSRQIGSVDKEITQAMATAWGYEYIDRQKILEGMRTQGVRWEEFGREFDEHYPNIWERYDRSYRGYVVLSQSIILNHALKDNVIIVGRGGNFLLREVPYSLNVRIIAPVDQRIEAIMKRENLSQSAAELLVKKVDKDMAGAVRLIYGKDIDDPSNYDLFFDVGVLPVQEIFAAIKAALSQKDSLKTPEAEKELKMKALAKKVKAGVITNPKLFIPVFDVLPGKDHLLVTGIVHNSEEHKKVEQEARKLAGEVPVECSLHYR
jgi:cytidylate kinase